MADSENTTIPPVADTMTVDAAAQTNETTEIKLDDLLEDLESQTDEQKRELLHKLSTAANLDYNRKKYEDAVEKYSQATELQAAINGETAPANADLLWEYGRCLFKVAISKSNVLGGGVTGDDGAKKKGKQGDLPMPADGASSKLREEKKQKGLLMIDDGMDDSEEEEDEDEGEDEDEDDLAVAYEILDLSRVLFEKQLEAQEDAQTDAPDTIAATQRQIKERLADVRDLQSEICLENERFDDAVLDSEATLLLRQELLPESSELIAEAHFKLALALEFSFNTSLRDDQEDGAVAAFSKANGSSSSAPANSKPDPERLWKAVEHMASAIQSCESRITEEEKKLPGLAAEDKAKKEKDMAEVKDITSDMITRVSEFQITTPPN
jgi:HAT1-interacting factor 1